jgi:acetyl-CoA acetyltransferase
MLCAPNEGGAAVVLSSRPAGERPVRVAAAQLRSHLVGSVLGEHTPLSGLVDDGLPTPTEMAAQAAYEECGLGPSDLDVVEQQDTDAAREILSAEELGLCPRGGGGRWVRDGGGEMTSALPVNPSGGLLSKGEPLGASALAQVVECTRQLRGGAGARQVDGARVALAHTVGRGANACVVVLTR